MADTGFDTDTESTAVPVIRHIPTRTTTRTTTLFPGLPPPPTNTPTDLSTTVLSSSTAITTGTNEMPVTIPTAVPTAVPTRTSQPSTSTSAAAAVDADAASAANDTTSSAAQRNWLTIGIPIILAFVVLALLILAFVVWRLWQRSKSKGQTHAATAEMGNSKPGPSTTTQLPTPLMPLYPATNESEYRYPSTPSLSSGGSGPTPPRRRSSLGLPPSPPSPFLFNPALAPEATMPDIHQHPLFAGNSSRFDSDQVTLTKGLLYAPSSSTSPSQHHQPTGSSSSRWNNSNLPPLDTGRFGHRPPVPSKNYSDPPSRRSTASPPVLPPIAPSPRLEMDDHPSSAFGAFPYPPSRPPQQSATHSPPPAAVDLSKPYTAKYTHTPRRPDETAIKSGDTLTVRKIYRDGWALGLNVTKRTQGYFPAAVLNIEDWIRNPAPLPAASSTRTHSDVSQPLQQQQHRHSGGRGTSDMAYGSQSSDMDDTAVTLIGPPPDTIRNLEELDWALEVGIVDVAVYFGQRKRVFVGGAPL
ncbi:hypothetical protein DFJ77DRAFT_476695 [Powellomyces hirtus]|nr:hypothetical protein DFJ77DRAFT_476695 [Powellomyces hirtus]